MSGVLTAPLAANAGATELTTNNATHASASNTMYFFILFHLLLETIFKDYFYLSKKKGECQETPG